MPATNQKYKIGILGATGTVGQRFITLLANHPHFEVARVGASTRSAGKVYKDAVAWKMASAMPDRVKDLVVLECSPEKFQGCHIIFSGLDSEYAGEIEMKFLKADFAVFSNAKNYRQDPSVPLVVPLVNADHLNLIPHQRKIHGLNKGFLVTNANCSTTGLVVALKPLMDAYGPLDQVIVHTMQAISGAGYPGCSALDILDNVVPYISGEEEKMEWEPLKILGSITKDLTSFELVPSTTRISATCNRVPVIDGHTMCVQVKFRRHPAPSPKDVEAILAAYTSAPQKLACTTSPEKAIYVSTECDRPQPKLDRDNGNGNAITVGRVRECPVLDIKFTLLVHNTILGAAGSGILNAEIAVAKGLISL
ncbi:aspartate-semialdehyde dehydrogenase [Entomophthora muscae]|uniref:Aspartate-semialdehyde dehydrogenase n=1 Tax=Entomophthora muscae TaxID=34485 RepID=A0ACC2UEM5_9FUNG|nr:aspartate-semialdehyde dehydrogenase [Entomophthora muscae]